MKTAAQIDEETRQLCLRTADRIAVSARRRRQADKGKPARRHRRGRATPRTGRDMAVDTVIRSVADPRPLHERDPESSNPLGPPEQVPVAFNRQVDVLEMERAHERISQSEYEAGLVVQAVFQRAHGINVDGPRDWAGGVRVDQAIAGELAIIRRLMSAREAQAFLERIEGVLYVLDARILKQVLGEGLSFHDVAVSQGRDGDRGKRYFAARFRDALGELAAAWAARGVARLVDDERYSLDPLPEIRGERAAPEVGEEFDADGIQVPAGKGYRLGANPEGRWRPAFKRKAAEAEAKRKLAQRRR